MVSLHLSWFVLYQNLRLKIISLWSLFLFFYFLKVLKYLNIYLCKKQKRTKSNENKAFAHLQRTAQKAEECDKP